jgi:hypothetical protein
MEKRYFLEEMSHHNYNEWKMRRFVAKYDFDGKTAMQWRQQ